VLVNGLLLHSNEQRRPIHVHCKSHARKQQHNAPMVRRGPFPRVLRVSRRKVEDDLMVLWIGFDAFDNRSQQRLLFVCGSHLGLASLSRSDCQSQVKKNTATVGFRYGTTWELFLRAELTYHRWGGVGGSRMECISAERNMSLGRACVAPYRLITDSQDWVVFGCAR
jgi:hypothetical protein